MPHVPDLIRDPKPFDNGIDFERGLGRGKPDDFSKFQNESLWNVSFSGYQTSVRVAANGGYEPALPDAAHSMNGGLTARFGSIE